jgi:hypothetical protein
MTERSPTPERPPLDRLVEELRRPPPRPAAALESVMRALPPEAGDARRGGRLAELWSWVREPRVTLSPIGALGGVLAVAASVLLGLGLADELEDGSAASGVVRHQFVLLAPEARSVSVVGDFNDWDAAVTPLTRDEREGVWVVEVELRSGRHLYSFVVDGDVWVPDDGVPRAPDDEFGRPSSVLLVRSAEDQE